MTPSQQHPPHSAGPGTQEAVGRGVILVNKMVNLVLPRLCVENQQKSKARNQEEKLVFPFLLPLLEAVGVKAPWAVRQLHRGKAGLRGLLLHHSSPAAPVSSTGPASLQHNPGLALILKRQYEVFQDKV